MESYSVKAVLSAVDKNMSSSFAKAASASESFGTKVNSVMTGVGKSLTVVGAAITAFGVKTISSYGDFTSSVNKAAVIAGSSNKDLQKNIGSLTNEALKLGKELPISAQDAGNAMVEMARNGASVGELKKEFPSIARAAAVAGEDLSATATTVQQSMNIWGGGAANAAKNSAMLAIVANKSNAEIGDMQQVFANVGTAAKNMGFSLKDVAIASGVMTNAGVPAAQASMDLNHALSQMLNPSKNASGLMHELGLSYVDANGNMKPFKQILLDTSKALSSYSGTQKTAALNTLFGAAGAKAMAPLLGSVAKGAIDGKNGWNDFSSALDKGAGSVDKANKYLKDNAQNMTHNVGDAIDQMKDAWQGMMFGAMNTSASIIQNMAKKFGDLADKISSSNTPMARFAKTFIAFAPMIGAATTAVGLFLTNISKVGSVMAGAAKFLVSPWGLALAAIVAVAGGLLYAYKQLQPFHDAVNNVGKALFSAFGTIARDAIGALKGLLEGLKDDFKQIGEAIQNQVGNKLKSVDFSDFASRASMAIQNVIAFIGQLLNAITDVITGFINVGAVQAVWDAIKEVFSAIVGLASAMLRPLQNIVTGLGDGAKSSNGWETLGEAIGVIAKVISGAIGYVSKFVTWLMKIPYLGSAIGAVVDGFLAFKLISPILNGVMKPLSLFTGKTKAVGKYAGVSAGQIAAMGVKALGIGVGIGVAAAGMGVFAMGVAKLAETGKAGIIALAAMTASIVVLAATFAILQGPLTSAIPAMLSLSVVMLSAGAAALMVGTAIAAAGLGINLAGQGIMTLVQAFVLLGQNMQMIIPVMAAIGAGFAMMIVGFVTALATQIPMVAQSMLQMLLTIMQTINAYLPQLILAGTNIIVNLLNGIAQALPRIVEAATNVIVNFLNSLTQNVPRLIPAGVNFIVAVLKGIAQNIPTLAGAALNVVLKFLGWLTDNAGKIIAAGVKFVLAVVKGVGDHLGEIANAALDLLQKFLNTLLKSLNRIIDMGIKFVESVVQGIGERVGQMPGEGLKLIGLFVKGVMKGLTGSRGAGKDNAGAVKDGVSGIDLFAQGSAIIGGFLKGLRSKFEAVKKFVGGIASWIKDNKGPISYDRKLLIPAGNAIMNGFNTGLVNQFGTVQSNIRSMTNSIAGMASNALNDNIQALNGHVNGSYSGSLTMQDSSLQMQNNALLRTIANKNTDLYLDGDTLVGGTADRMDNRLGNNTRLGARFN